MPSADKNEPSKITGSRVVGGNYTRHEQREFTCSARKMRDPGNEVDALTSKRAQNHEISVYFATNSIVAFCHAPP